MLLPGQFSAELGGFAPQTVYLSDIAPELERPWSPPRERVTLGGQEFERTGLPRGEREAAMRREAFQQAIEAGVPAHVAELAEALDRPQLLDPHLRPEQERAPVRGTPEYLEMLEAEEGVRASFRAPTAPARGSSEWEDALRRELELRRELRPPPASSAASASSASGQRITADMLATAGVVPEFAAILEVDQVLARQALQNPRMFNFQWETRPGAEPTGGAGRERGPGPINRFLSRLGERFGRGGSEAAGGREAVSPGPAGDIDLGGAGDMESEIDRLIELGLSDEEIARRLGGG